MRCKIGKKNRMHAGSTPAVSTTIKTPRRGGVFCKTTFLQKGGVGV